MSFGVQGLGGDAVGVGVQLAGAELLDAEPVEQLGQLALERLLLGHAGLALGRHGSELGIVGIHRVALLLVVLRVVRLRVLPAAAKEHFVLVRVGVGRQAHVVVHVERHVVRHVHLHPS